MGLFISTHDNYCSEKDSIRFNRFLIITRNNIDNSVESIEMDNWNKCLERIEKRNYEKHVIKSIIKYGYYQDNVLHISIRNRERIKFKYFLFVNITSVSYSGSREFVISKMENVSRDEVINEIEDFGIYKTSEYILQRHPIL